MRMLSGNNKMTVPRIVLAAVLVVIMTAQAAMLGGCGQSSRTEAPAETPAQAPVETPAQAPVETPAQAPVETPADGTEAPAANTMTAYRADGSAVILEDCGDGTWKTAEGAVYYAGEDGVLRARGLEDLCTDPSAVPVRQDGERFDAVIVLEGMEETVHYEHIRNVTLGIEMDYDYESFVRRSDADRECFVSVWDDPEHPENYLELRYNPQDAESVAGNISAALMNRYEISRDDSFMLERAGRCIRIDASADVGGLTMPDQLQMVYIIPAPDGCCIAAAHYAIEGSEGFGRRFRYMMDSFSAIPGQGEKRLTNEQALCAVRNYCCIRDPELDGIVKAGDYPVYWDASSSEENEIVVVFRSYTGSLNRYYIDPVSGDARVTELVPGSVDEERQTDESLNVWNYLF